MNVQKHGKLCNLYFIAPVVFITSLVIGIAFYMIVNDWDFSVSYFFATTVLLGNMYLIPTEPNSLSETFTLWYFLWGSSLLAGAVTALANDLVSTAIRVAADERQRIFKSIEPYDADNDGVVGFTDKFQYYISKLVYKMGWYEYQAKYMTLLCFILWLIVGVLYGMCYEEWGLFQSVYFAFAAVSASGSSPPACVGPSVYDCSIGTERSYLIGTYIIVGVPLFAYTVGQFAGLIVEQAVRAKEHQLMIRPLTEEEFIFAKHLRKGVLYHKYSDTNQTVTDGRRDGQTHVQSNFASNETTNTIDNDVINQIDTKMQGSSGSDKAANTSSFAVTVPQNTSDVMTSFVGNSPGGSSDLTIDLGEFIVLELLRLQKIEMEDLLCLKTLFEEIDDSGDGVIDMAEMRRHNLLVGKLATSVGTRKVDTHGVNSYTPLSGDDKRSYGALNQQDDDEKEAVVSSTIGGVCSPLHIVDRTPFGGSTPEMTMEEGDNSTNDSDKDRRKGLKVTYSEMYNNLVIPVVKLLHDRAELSPVPCPAEEEEESTSSKKLSIAQYLAQRRRNSTSDIDSMRSQLVTTTAETPLPVVNDKNSPWPDKFNRIGQSKSRQHFEIEPVRNRSNTTGSIGGSSDHGNNQFK